jgi:hypothetical protein
MRRDKRCQYGGSSQHKQNNEWQQPADIEATCVVIHDKVSFLSASQNIFFKYPMSGDKEFPWSSKIDREMAHGRDGKVAKESPP